MTEPVNVLSKHFGAWGKDEPPQPPCLICTVLHACVGLPLDEAITALKQLGTMLSCLHCGQSLTCHQLSHPHAAGMGKLPCRGVVP